MSWLLFFENPCDVKKECPSGVVKSSSLSSNAECLARESADKKLEVGEFRSVDCCSVSVVFMVEVPFVDFNCVLIDFTKSDEVCSFSNGVNDSDFKTLRYR